MEELINSLAGLMADTIASVLTSLYHNWLPLSLAILTATLMKVFVNTEKLKETLLKKTKISILASVIFGAFTPLCACGTMAVVIGFLTTALPWAPVMAFLTSSPLMSPDGFIMNAGIINIRFAIALAIASVVIGLSSGWVTYVIERKTDYLKDQLRFTKSSETMSCGCGTTASTCECTTTTSFQKFIQKNRIMEIKTAFIQVGLKQILLYFTLFAGVGYLIQSFVPTSFIVSLFSGNNIFSVPLAALIGLPLYVSGEGAVPIIRTLMDQGASESAMLAFMITGPATSAWVIAGISSFMKKRVIGLYIGYILVSAIILGYIYQLLMALNL